MGKIDLVFLQNELKRTSDWISFSDKKSAIISVYYSGIFSFIIFNKAKIESLIVTFKDCQWYLSIFLLITIAISFMIGTFYLLRSIFPNVKNNFTDTSLFYFGNIAKIKFIDYSKKMEKLTEEEAKKQISEQIYTNALIANYKMKSVQNSIKSLCILLILILILALIH